MSSTEESKENRRKMLRRWEQIHIDKNYQDAFISEEIKASWERSKAYNVDQLKKSNDAILTEKEFKKAIEANKEYIKIVLPVMQNIYSITKGSGFCIIFSDDNGCILRIIGDEDAVEFVRRVNLVEGSLWSEQYMGTCGYSMAKALDKLVQVNGYEHYCKYASPATCIASPIKDGKNENIGFISLTGPYEQINAHSAGMLFAATKAIEREVHLTEINKKTRSLYKEAQLANIHKKDIIKSFANGLISIDENGIIDLMNDKAARLLNLPCESCIDKKIDSIIPMDENYHFINKIKSNKGFNREAFTITINNKQSKYLVDCTPRNSESHNVSGSIIILQEFHSVINKLIITKPDLTFDKLIGNSSLFNAALEEAYAAAETDSNILLLGESGVGKDVFAQAIHNESFRKERAFIAVNCAAIPRELIGSELFGYEEGAFTGARKGGNPGKFELADQGTLFLDEIGEMPIDLQVNLLRVLEERTITRLGGKHPIPTNIRLISATNRDLSSEIKANNFRRDLYYRLQVITINVPALRERKDDIPLLVEYFIEDMSSKLDKRIKGIDPSVMDILINYNWPGNIRELRNVMERAVNLTKDGIINVELLPDQIVEASTNKISRWKKHPSSEEIEERLIKEYLLNFKYNKSQVAQALNISRSSLYKKMKNYNIT